MPWIVAAAIYALLMMLGPRLLADPDTYSHIALGRWILRTPRGAERRSAFADHARRTLGCLRVAVAGRLRSRAFARRLDRRRRARRAAVAAAFGLLTRFLLRRMAAGPDPDRGARRLRAGVTAYSGAAACAGAAADGGLGGEPDPRSRRAARAAVAFAAADDAVGEPARQFHLRARDRSARSPATRSGTRRQPNACGSAGNGLLFGLLALAAACINPYGPAMILVTFKTAALGEALSIITEWRPQDFSHLGAFEMIMLAGFGYRALSRREIAAAAHSDAVWCLCILGLSQSRHADLARTCWRRYFWRGRWPNNSGCSPPTARSADARVGRVAAGDGRPAADRRDRLCRGAPGHGARRQYHAGERAQIVRCRQERPDPQRLRLRRLSRFCRHRALHRRARRALRLGLHHAPPPRAEPAEHSGFPGDARRIQIRRDACLRRARRPSVCSTGCRIGSASIHDIAVCDVGAYSRRSCRPNASAADRSRPFPTRHRADGVSLRHKCGRHRGP